MNKWQYWDENELNPITDEKMNNIANLMNDEIREQVHRELAPCTHSEFIDRYVQLCPEFAEILKTEFSITDSPWGI